MRATGTIMRDSIFNQMQDPSVPKDSGSGVCCGAEASPTRHCEDASRGMWRRKWECYLNLWKEKLARARARSESEKIYLYKQ